MAKSLKSEIGGNSRVDGDALGRYVERIEHLHEARDELNGDIKAVYAEAKSAGFVTGIMRQIVRERRMEETERHDHYALLENYRAALGLLADTPLGEAALRAVDEGARAEAESEARTGDAPRRVRKPRAFAKQPLHQPRPRGRPRKNAVDEALTGARAHLGNRGETADEFADEPLGVA